MRLGSRILFLAAIFTVLAVCPSPGNAWREGGYEPLVSYYSFFNGWGPNEHALDGVERFLTRGERLHCDAAVMVRHRGQAIRYTARVHPALLSRLRRFEDFVVDLGTAHYGRPPRRLVHKGSFACRRARGRRGRVSEHALGNALDLVGFDFGPLPRAHALPDGAPRRLRRSFRVRVLNHWQPRRRRDQPHARFLHALAEGLRHRPHIFRGIVGPPRPRHRDHLHLDAAPWRYAMFGYDPVDEGTR